MQITPELRTSWVSSSRTPQETELHLGSWLLVGCAAVLDAPLVPCGGGSQCQVPAPGLSTCKGWSASAPLLQKRPRSLLLCHRHSNCLCLLWSQVFSQRRMLILAGPCFVVHSCLLGLQARKGGEGGSFHARNACLGGRFLGESVRRLSVFEKWPSSFVSRQTA